MGGWTDSKYSNCSFRGESIDGYKYVGGLIGDLNSLNGYVLITDCTVEPGNGEVMAQDSYVGSVAGYLNTSPSHSTYEITNFNGSGTFVVLRTGESYDISHQFGVVNESDLGSVVGPL